MTFRILILLLLSLFSLIIRGQILPTSSEKEFSNLFLRQRALFPQEKTYLHIDREYYIPGDTVWLCGYAVDASTLIPDILSRYLYVDMQNPDGVLAQQIKVLNRNGVFPGYLVLPIDLSAGSYTISAYTLFMAGMDESYFFRRPFYVSKPSPTLIIPEISFKHTPYDKSKSYIKVAPSPELFDVSFFPEGGYLLAGNVSAVGVKALKSNGMGEDITGTLFDSSGDVVATFETVYKGIGSFLFIPEARKGYYAICKNKQGHAKRFYFPEALTDAVALQVAHRGKRLYLNVGNSSGITIPDNLILLVQSKGIVHYAQKLETPKTVIFNEEQLPSGILHFLLLNEDRHILSERLVFLLNKKEQPRITLKWDKPVYNRREKVQSKVSVLDSEDIPLTGQFSVSVTNDRDVLPDTTCNIVTELLLSSELKGYVEAPGWYFANDEQIRQHALDALMLTQGWRRYDVPKLLQGDFQRVEAILEMSMELSGRVKSLISSKASVGTPVYLVGTNTNLFRTTKTDEEGRFHFSNFESPDSLTAIVRAVSKRNNDKVELIVNKESTIEIAHPTIPHSYSLAEINLDASDFLRDSLFTAKAKRKWTIENEMRTIHLDEVLIRGSHSVSHPTLFSVQGTLYDQEYLKKYSIKSLDQFFTRVPHVRIGSPNGSLSETAAIYVKGLGKPNYSKTAVYINNSMIPDEDFSIWDISFDMIESIEVNRVPTPGLNSLSHSVRIWLKKDWSPQVEAGWNQQTVTLRGYQPPVEFYSPKYETIAERNRELPDLRTTIYWNPALQTDERGATAFEFYTSGDLPTTYSVVIEGITSDGRIIRSTGKVDCR